jgi:hypothetical protein
MSTQEALSKFGGYILSRSCSRRHAVLLSILSLALSGHLSIAGQATPSGPLSCGEDGTHGLPSNEKVRANFKSPPKSCRPMIRWWWPGGDVADPEIAREISLFDRTGFGGVELQPFRFGLKHNLPADAEARVNDYLTPSFFGHVRTATDELRQRGMWLDLTFGSGWPFGGGLNMTPELASMELRFTRRSIHGPSTFHEQLVLPVAVPETGAFVQEVIGGSQPMPAGWNDRLKDRTKLVAVIAVQGSQPETGTGPAGLIASSRETITRSGILAPSTTQVLTANVLADGTLDWQVPAGDWELLTFAESPADLWVLGGVGKYPQLVLDHLKLAAMESHIQRVGEAAKSNVGAYFGNGIRAIFCDSLEVRAYIYWTDSFLADFKRLRGYDLTPFLPFIRQPGFADPYGSWEGKPEYDAPEVGDRIRRDYWQTVSDVMETNFYRPFDDWARRNHLLARVQAHGAPADIFKVYGESDIPETEQLYAGGQSDFLRMAASAAHVYGRPIASSESFAKAGNPYSTTPEKIKVWSDQLFAAGINEIIYHGYPYQYPVQPRWYPFTSPLAFTSDLDENNPFWKYIRPLNEYITRIQYMAQSGKNVAQVAVYRSALSYEARTMPNPQVDDYLIAAGYNFDQFNGQALLESHVESGRLIAPGGATYAALMIVDERRIPLPLAEKLQHFQRQGFRILFVSNVPKEEIGFKDWKKRTRQIQESLKGFTPVKDLDEAILRLKAISRPDVDYRQGSSSTPFFHRRLNGLDVFFFSNPDPHPRSIEVVLPSHSSPEDWNPWTGEVTNIDSFENVDNRVAVKIELPPYGSKLIAFDPSDHHRPRSPERVTAPLESLLLSGPASEWAISAGNLNVKVQGLVDWLDTRELKTFSGRAEYETKFSISPDWLQTSSHIQMDLGEVGDVAEVSVNGKSVAQLFFRPYRCDVTGLLRPGLNILSVVVTNSPTNHLLASGVDLSNAAAPKPEPEHSGLIGPVRLLRSNLANLP